MQEILKFKISDIKLIQEISDSQLAIAEVKVCRTGQNAHNKPIDLESLKAATPTLINKFLVAGFDGFDFKGHDKKEQIIGFFPKENNLKFIEEDGETYLIAIAIVSKIYANWAFEIFKNDNYRECSMEITVLETEIRDDGFEWITQFIFNGVTVLGKYLYKAACSGSSLELIQFSTEQMIEDCERVYQKYLTLDKYDSLDFTIPEKVQENAKKAIDLKLDGTSVSFATGRKLANGGVVNPKFIHKIYKYFSKNEQNENWEFFGGIDGFQWSKNLIDQMKSIDDIRMQIDFAEPIIDLENGKGGEIMFNKEEFVAQFSLTTDEIFELMRTCLDEFKYEADNRQLCKYWVITYNNEYMFCYDEENGGKVAIPFVMEDNKVVVNIEGIKKAKMVTKWIVEEDDAFAESDDDDIYMSIKTKFSSDANTEATAQAALNAKEAENFKELSEKFAEAEITMATLKAENEVLMAEKKTKEEADKQNQVEFALQDEDVQKYLSKNKIEELRQDSINFAIEDIDAWVNKVNAAAFLASKDAPPQENILRMGLPFYSKNTDKKTGSLYDNL